jgi:flagellar basal-body rod modification protein FlgD
LANQNTFLQLLVAQLQYQDPTQPMDGTTFVTQLAQFSDLQANMGSKQDLDAISQQYLGTTPSASSGTSPTSSGTGS